MGPPSHARESSYLRSLGYCWLFLLLLFDGRCRVAVVAYRMCHILLQGGALQNRFVFPQRTVSLGSTPTHMRTKNKHKKYT